MERGRARKESGSDTADFDRCVRIFEAEFDYVYRTLRRLGASPADAEDLAQDVFLVMWRRRWDWDPSRPLRPWLVAVAVRVAQSHRRRTNREVPMGVIDLEEGRSEVQQQLDLAEARRLVAVALATLPEKQRVVFVLHELEGVAVREAAAALGIPLFTAYTRLRAARSAFAKAVRRTKLVAGAETLRDPQALLASQREAVPPDEEVRGRVISRLRAVVPPAPEVGSSPRWHGPERVALAVAAVMALFALRPASGPKSGGLAGPRALGATAAPSLAAGALGRGLVGYWSFDDARSSELVHDQSGNGNDCVAHGFDHGTGPVDGPRGKGFQLNGVGWFECARTETLARIDRELTIAAWVLQVGKQKNLRAFVSRQRGHDSDDDFFLGLTNGDRDVILSSSVWPRIERPFPPGLGRWHHVAATRSADGQMRLYVDGAEVGSRQGAPVGLGSAANGNPLIIGGAANTAAPGVVTQRFGGGLDEVMIYDRALSGAEIGALAQGAAPAPGGVALR